MEWERVPEAEGTAWAKALRCAMRQTEEGSTATDKSNEALKARSTGLYFSVGQD